MLSYPSKTEAGFLPGGQQFPLQPVTMSQPCQHRVPAENGVIRRMCCCRAANMGLKRGALGSLQPCDTPHHRPVSSCPLCG